MKLSRLLEITLLLLNRKTMRAAELAERFGVSVRTIYRDIDELSAAGVPVYTTQGAGGGISILEDYTLSRTALTREERDSLLLAVKSLQSTRFPEASAVLDKLGGLFSQPETDWISIDFSPWGGDPGADNRLADIRTGILQGRVIEIDYLSSYGEQTTRQIEPLQLIYKSRAWYLWGYCLLKRDDRFFRLSRMKRTVVTDRFFDRAAAKNRERKQSPPGMGKPPVPLILRFTREALYRLYDDYGAEQLRDNGDGTYTLEITFPEDEWVYGYLLSFGPFVRVMEPPHIREILYKRAAETAALYQQEP